MKLRIMFFGPPDTRYADTYEAVEDVMYNLHGIGRLLDGNSRNAMYIEGSDIEPILVLRLKNNTNFIVDSAMSKVETLADYVGCDIADVS
jgi:hypothetical protein